MNRGMNMGLKGHSRSKSIHVMLVYTGGCNGCDIEIVNAVLSPRFDLEQYNVYLTWNPREADVLVVSGPVVHWTKEPLLKIYEAIPDPKLVVAVGACALTGGVYKNIHGDIPSEEIEGPVENVIPVDAKIPGCAVRAKDVVAGVASVIPIINGLKD
jgi:energy-converting hydrogenase B subunit M